MKNKILLIGITCFLSHHLLAQGVYVKFKKPEIFSEKSSPIFLANYFDIRGFQYAIHSQKGKVSSGLLSFTMEESFASPKLWKNLFQPETPMDLELIFTKISGGNEVTYLTIRCNNSYLNAINSQTQANEITELHMQVWVNEYSIQYKEFGQSGNTLGSFSTGWNYLKNIPNNF